MKHIFVLAISLGAFALSSAMAQDHHPHGGGGGGHPAPAHVSGGGHPTVHSGGAHPSSSVHNNHRPAIRTVHTTVRVHPHTTTVHRTVTHGHVTAVHRTTTHSIHAVSTHRHVTPAVAHRHGAYVRPAGWYAHRWAYGERLPGGWYGHNYWIVDFSLFGLITPPYDYEWIRVGDDALLVDIDTGEILRVEYGVFY
jgi:Ni/Co efflux regulator RcnB